MSSKLPVVLLVAAVLMASVAVSTIPASKALIQRDFSYLNDNHLTVRTGNTKVCGDHLCAAGEWDKLQTSINSAQLGKGTQGTTPTTTTPSITNSGSSAMCTSVKDALAGASVGPVKTQKVLSALGC